MKWIPATELPDSVQDYGQTFWISENIIVRNIATKTVVDNSSFGNYGKVWGLDKYEWLDESEPIGTPIAKNESESAALPVNVGYTKEQVEDAHICGQMYVLLNPETKTAHYLKAKDYVNKIVPVPVDVGVREGAPEREPVIGEVWKSKEGRKFVVTTSKLKDMEGRFYEYEYVCSKAHEDGDFSYLCTFQWCRCYD